MAKKSEQNYISLKLPPDYYYDLVDIAISELEEASKKWKVKIDEKDKEDILEHSSTQLVKKVEDITYFPYSLYDEEIKIGITDERKDIPEIAKNEYFDKKPIITVGENLMDNELLSGVSIVFNATHGYSFVNIATRKTVMADNFYEYFMKNMEKWLRTAVFYGVASCID